VVTDDDMRLIVGAALMQDEDNHFGHLVAVLAQTGARFSQAARIKVADLKLGPEPIIMMPVSRKGRRNPNKPDHVPVPVGADLIELLKPRLIGRVGNERLLMHWTLRQVAGDDEIGRSRRWVKDRLVPWTSASQMRDLWAKAISQADIQSKPQPYRLRDASIIWGLRAGNPVRLVAALHDTSSEMIEKHYSQHISDALAKAARNAVVPVTKS
jgi:integrase